LRDHLLVKTDRLISEGHPLAEAQDLAVEALGNPEIIASEWVRVLRSRSWLSRHPCLAGVLGFLLIWGFYLLSIMAFQTFQGHPIPFQLELWLFSMNWMPWSIGMVFLFWKTTRTPVGWGPLMWWCVALGLATSAWDFHGSLSHTTGQPYLWIVATTWTMDWAYPLCWYFDLLDETGFHNPSDTWGRVSFFLDLVKLILPLLSWVTARWFLAQSMGNKQLKPVARLCN
jgi:hypothetical protein